ncbi:hypothetical protein V6N13_039060 [Hibiscus sabdariffa]|uniref:Uncharacterized protein n=1 Tax=Hibiscus sabdariffa TaxID=183260 RepID=A0ABR2SWP2_9ROSI
MHGGERIGANKNVNICSNICLPMAECKEHLQLPATYFGNCIISRLAAAKKSELLGENRILTAATVISSKIMEFKKQPFKDAEESLRKIIENFEMGKDIVLAPSSAKVGYCKADFGWGSLERPCSLSLDHLDLVL